MTILLIIVMLAIIFAVFATVGPEGLWHNLIALVNVTFAALIATNAYEPLALRLHYTLPSVGYFADFLVLWVLFAIAVVVLQFVTNFTSRVRVRVGTWFDQVAGFALAIVTGWVLVCFTMTTLHTAPIPREAFGNALAPRLDAKFPASLAPDRVWLNTAQRLSQGDALGSGDADAPAFDPAGQFILKHATRRHDNYQHESGLFADREWGRAVPLPGDAAKP